MKVLHVSVRADIGGGPRYVDILINNLPEDFKNYVAAPNDEPYFSLWKNNPKVSDILEIPHRKFSLNALLKLYTFTKKNDIKIVHANGKGAGVYVRLLRLLISIKVVFTFHGIHIDEYSNMSKKLYLWYERLMTTLTDKIICVSYGEFDKGVSLKLFNSKKAQVIYNAVGLPKFTNQVVDLDPNYFYVITVSRFDFQKNMQLSVEIAKKLSDFNTIKFLWIGDGPDKEAIKNEVIKLGLRNIIFTGFILPEQVFNYLCKADLYLTTSRWEGLPFSLVEACSLGVPVISTNVIGNQEVVVDNFNGFLFEEHDIEKATHSIKKLSEDADLLNLMKKNALKLYDDKFTLSEFIKAHLEVYKK